MRNGMRLWACLDGRAFTFASDAARRRCRRNIGIDGGFLRSTGDIESVAALVVVKSDSRCRRRPRRENRLWRKMRRHFTYYGHLPSSATDRRRSPSEIPGVKCRRHGGDFIGCWHISSRDFCRPGDFAVIGSRHWMGSNVALLQAEVINAHRRNFMPIFLEHGRRR